MLQDAINAQLAPRDALGTVSDLYYLPGSQLDPVGYAGFSGNTNTDATIVVVG